MSQRIRAGSGDAAERDRLAADGMASLDVPVASLLATPPLMSATTRLEAPRLPSGSWW